MILVPTKVVQVSHPDRAAVVVNGHPMPVRGMTTVLLMILPSGGVNLQELFPEDVILILH